MAIVVNLYYSGEGSAAADFAREMTERGIVAQIRAREGNLRYDYYRDFADPSTVLLFDVWRDQEALDEHHASPIMQEILDLRQKYGLTVRAERLLLDEGEIPEQDRAYLDH